MIAAAMIVLGSALDLPQAVMIAGVILMIFAVVLAVVALVLTVRLRTTLVLDPESITIIKGRRRRVVRLVNDRHRQTAGTAAVVDH